MASPTSPPPPAYACPAEWGVGSKRIRHACMCQMVENTEVMCDILDTLWPNSVVRDEVVPCLNQYALDTMLAEEEGTANDMDRWNKAQFAGGVLVTLRRLARVMRRRNMRVSEGVLVEIERRAWCTLLGESLSSFEGTPPVWE